MNFTKDHLPAFPHIHIVHFLLPVHIHCQTYSISRLWLRANVCLRLLRSKAFADCMRKPWPALLNMFCWSVQIYFLHSQSSGAALACWRTLHVLMLKRFSYFSSTFESMLTYVVFWPKPASLWTNVHCSGFSSLWSSSCAWTSKITAIVCTYWYFVRKWESIDTMA